jgi:putative photosynthetic complex assembly protein 2
MSVYLLPAAYALFVWWFSTGVIIYLDGLPRSTFRWSLIGATLVLLASLYGLRWSSADTSVMAAYAAFTYGLLAWGWQEITFYMGYVTGPRKEACPEDCSGWKHFGHAVATSLYHELAIIAAAVIVVALTWSRPNQIGTWTFMVLWWMHQSAKLNVFLGVRNLNEEFLPEHLQFLRRFLTKKPMNLLFPISVTVSTVIAVKLAQAAMQPGANDFERAGFTFLTMLMSLAILEHWFLVLPLPSAQLWHWGLKSRAVLKPFDVDIAAGFLGAGKTTFLRRVLTSADPNVRTVALVNDFSELGVDGSLLRGRGADVVELPNGCICCSLKKDLAQSLKDIVGKWAPERVLIEPSGVADVGSLINVLHQPDIAPMVRSLTTHTVIDSGAFLRDYARLPDHFEAQADLANAFILNKIDVVSPAELQAVVATLRALNPRAAIVPCRYGQVDAAWQDKLIEPVKAFAGANGSVAGASGQSESANADHHHHHDHDRPHAHHDTHHDTAHRHSHGETARAASHAHDGEDHDHDHVVALGLESWSARLDGPCDPQGLRGLLDNIVAGAYGEVERVKGIVPARDGWIHFDVAGGRSSVAAFAPRESEVGRVMAIGRTIDTPRLQAAFNACLSPQAL